MVLFRPEIWKKMKLEKETIWIRFVENRKKPASATFFGNANDILLVKRENYEDVYEILSMKKENDEYIVKAGFTFLSMEAENSNHYLTTGSGNKEDIKDTLKYSIHTLKKSEFSDKKKALDMIKKYKAENLVNLFIK